MTNPSRVWQILVCALFLVPSLLLATTVTFYGGAGQVGGSGALVENETTCVMVDCGCFYEDESETEGLSSQNHHFGFDPQKVNDVLLTHAHQDHAGRLAHLIRSGFKGTIWMTPPSREILAILLPSQALYDDSDTRAWRWSAKGKGAATVHWRKACTGLSRVSEENRRTFNGTYSQLVSKISPRAIKGCTRCAALDAERTLAQIKTIDYGQTNRIGNLNIVFRNVRHLPGAAAIYISDGSRKLVFSGDLGTTRSHLVHEIEPAEKVDCVFIESTYGDRPREQGQEAEEEYAAFRKNVGENLRAGKIVWIPAFALDRSQRVLAEIANGIKAGEIPTNSPVYYLSPSSRKIAHCYASHPNWFEPAVRETITNLHEVLTRVVPHFNPDKAKGKPAILLTTSGMMDQGASAGLLKDLAPRTDVSIYLVGYQAPGTNGYKLQNGASQLKVGKQTFDVKATVQTYRCFSGHGDARENDAWLKNNLNSHIYLIHGDAANLKARKEGLEQRFGAHVTIAEPNCAY